MQSNLALRDGLFKRVKISPFDASGKWILLEEFVYHVGFKGSEETIVIPAGFIFNGMSIPRVFWGFVHPMSADTIIASLVHDYLFYTKMYSLDKSDYIFYEILTVCEVFWLEKILLYV
jgi:hypothetical protein